MPFAKQCIATGGISFHEDGINVLEGHDARCRRLSKQVREFVVVQPYCDGRHSKPESKQERWEKWGKEEGRRVPNRVGRK